MGSGKPDLGVAGGVGGRGGEVCGGGGVPVAFWGREQADELRRKQGRFVVGLGWLGVACRRTSTVRLWPAAAMVAAAAFQGAGRGVGAWVGVEWRGEERERGMAK